MSKDVYAVRWRQDGNLKQKEYRHDELGMAQKHFNTLKRNQVEVELIRAYPENAILSILDTEVRFLMFHFRFWHILGFLCGALLAYFLSGIKVVQ